ncbi:MAG: hypothetical protein IT377_04645 [Polyangiaceae bacterium]|nr:hypothetical protein [Polyangiaceae bacterium]
MRSWLFGATFALSSVAWVLAGGCSASSSGGGGGSGSGGAGAGGSGGGGGIGNTGGGLNDSGPGDGPAGDACAELQVEAKQAPLGMLMVIDKSTSMAQSGKWTAAQLAIVQAIDTAGFDHLSLGLTAYPAGEVPGPPCVAGFPVACGVSALPQVPIADTGTAKSNAPGVRQSIYNWLAATQPNGSATPGYDALKAGLAGLGAYSLPAGALRVVVLITDGGFTCTSLASPPRPAYKDAIGCEDWENPDNVVSLLDAAYKDASKPTRTIVIGVPGSDTKPTDTDAPPYYMRRALSAFAKAGAPDLVPAGCDGTYQQSQGDPAVPCHYDLTKGTFNAQALADSIVKIRGTVLGCVYQLPDPGPGKAIDKNKVNVVVTLDGKVTTVPKRSDPNDTCQASPCWDYDAGGQVVLIGALCSDVQKSTNAKVEIQVGCATIVK